MKNQVENIRNKGRFGDTELVHLNPVEIGIMDSVVPGGLSVNPDTGLKEGFFFLPALLGGLGALGAGGLFGAAPAAAGLGAASTLPAGLGAIGTTAASLPTAVGAGTLGAGALGAGAAAPTLAGAAAPTAIASGLAPEIAASTALLPEAAAVLPEAVAPIAAETLTGPAMEAAINPAIAEALPTMAPPATPALGLETVASAAPITPEVSAAQNALSAAQGVPAAPQLPPPAPQPISPDLTFAPNEALFDRGMSIPQPPAPLSPADVLGNRMGNPPGFDPSQFRSIEFRPPLQSPNIAPTLENLGPASRTQPLNFLDQDLANLPRPEPIQPTMNDLINRFNVNDLPGKNTYGPLQPLSQRPEFQALPQSSNVDIAPRINAPDINTTGINQLAELNQKPIMDRIPPGNEIVDPYPGRDWSQGLPPRTEVMKDPAPFSNIGSKGPRLDGVMPPISDAERSLMPMQRSVNDALINPQDITASRYPSDIHPPLFQDANYDSLLPPSDDVTGDYLTLPDNQSVTNMDFESVPPKSFDSTSQMPTAESPEEEGLLKKSWGWAKANPLLAMGGLAMLGSVFQSGPDGDGDEDYEDKGQAKPEFEVNTPPPDYVPGIDPEFLMFRHTGYGFAEGGAVPDVGMPGASRAVSPETVEKLIERAIMAVDGQTENPDLDLEMLRQVIGDEQFAEFMDMFAGGEAGIGGGGVGGIGGGASDNVPAMIDGAAPASLSSGEYVIPSDVVSHVGDGNTNAGVAALDGIVNQIRQAKTGNPEMPPALGLV